MPRIDPQQLLTCLQVLLAPNGGILSGDEVQRLVNLMTKFSKKLVSKCIYILILRNTDKMLLAQFMAEGGWNLIYSWLQDANMNKNWALVTEVLELLLITPVDVERLKMNNLPKLIKGLTKREDLPGVQQRSSTLVEEWLKIVKDVTKAEAANQAVKKEPSPPPEAAAEVKEEMDEPMAVDSADEDNKFSENVDGTNCTLRYKVIIKDGKKVISKVEPSEPVTEVSSNVEISTSETVVSDDSDKKERKDKDDKKKEKSNHDRNKHKSSSVKSSKSSSSSSSRSKDRSSGSSKSSSSSKDRRDKDRHRSSSSSKHKSSSTSSKSSSSSKDKDKKESKEKQAEKDKDTLAKIQPQTLNKLGRIPKKTDSKEEAKKPTFSVEVRKGEDKPKTVKVYNSKMRSTGLLEEAKPPPPRNAAVKKPAPVLPAVIPTKRPSPIRDAIPPPEKKSRLLEVPERPGAIKLIPPKPKRLAAKTAIRRTTIHGAISSLCVLVFLFSYRPILFLFDTVE